MYLCDLENCYKNWQKPGMQSLETIFSDSLKGTLSRLFDCFDEKKNSSNLFLILIYVSQVSGCSFKSKWSGESNVNKILIYK